MDRNFPAMPGGDNRAISGLSPDGIQALVRSRPTRHLTQAIADLTPHEVALAAGGSGDIALQNTTHLQAQRQAAGVNSQLHTPAGDAHELNF